MSEIVLSRKVGTNEATLRVVSADRSQVRNLTPEEFTRIGAALKEANIDRLLEPTIPFPPLDLIPAHAKFMQVDGTGHMKPRPLRGVFGRR